MNTNRIKPVYFIYSFWDDQYLKCDLLEEAKEIQKLKHFDNRIYVCYDVILPEGEDK